MLIILITLASATAHTTRSFVNIDINGNYRSVIPVLKVNFGFGTGNGRRTMKPDYVTYSEGVKGQDFDGRGVDTQYSQYPYHVRRSTTARPWIKGIEATTPSSYDRSQDFDITRGHDTTRYGQYPYDRRESTERQWIKGIEATTPNSYDDGYRKSWQAFDYITTKKSETIGEETNYGDKPNGSVDESRIISKQSDDVEVNYTKVDDVTAESNGTEITYYDVDFNKSINLDHSVDNTSQIADVDRKGFNSTKTTEENEVTGHESRSEDKDRWVWDVETTTVPDDLGNRASFAGSKCPVGKTRLKDSCVGID